MGFYKDNSCSRIESRSGLSTGCMIISSSVDSNIISSSEVMGVTVSSIEGGWVDGQK